MEIVYVDLKIMRDFSFDLKLDVKWFGIFALNIKLCAWFNMYIDNFYNFRICIYIFK